MKKLTLLSLIAAMSLGVVGCDDDGDDDDPGVGPVESTEMMIRCHVAGLLDLQIPASLDVDMSVPLEDGGTADATIDVTSTLGEEIANLMLSIGGETVTLSELTATVDFTGTDITGVDLSDTSVPTTIDFGDPGPPIVPEVNVIATDTAVETLVNDGSTEITATLAALTVGLTDVPVLTSLTLTVPSTATRCMEDAAACTPVTEDCFGADDAMGVLGWCGDNSGATIGVFCEFPSDGSDTVTFAVPTPVPAP